MPTDFTDLSPKAMNANVKTSEEDARAQRGAVAAPVRT